MKRPALNTGTVVRYPYLWHREQASGETEGRKTRPVAVALNTGKQVAFLPITGQPPSRDMVAIEIPDLEKKRASLEMDKRLWIVIDELNIDHPSKRHYIEPGSVLGVFSKSFFGRVLLLLRQNLTGLRQVMRR
jgi:hypothetical protein